MKHTSLALFTVAVLFIGFQNCAPANFSTAAQESSELTLSLKQFQPALAVRSTVCLNCHANLQGNLITDFDQSGGVAEFMDAQGNGGEYPYPNYGHGNRMFWGTSFIQGTVFVPPALLTADAQSSAATMIAEEKQILSQIPSSQSDFPANYPAPAVAGLTANTNGHPVHASEYINAALNGRTPGYRSWLAKFPTAFTNISSLADTPVKEVSSVKIGAPAASDIRAQMQPGQSMTYVPTKAQVALNGFKSSDNGAFFQNDPSVPMTCDGDLFVDAPVVLVNLQLQTQNGCRIYATGTVFIQGSTSYNGGEGIQFTGGANANLQISSATGVSMGLGQCTSQGLPNDSYAGAPGAGNSTLGGRMQIPYNRLDLLNPMFADYKKITDRSGNPLLVDAGDCSGSSAPARKVAFNHLLLNAPRIDSRYSGDFNGVIITGFFMGSLGGIIYTYDSLFENVAILPRLNQGAIFSITPCTQSAMVDSNLSVCK